jgi:hypothetical protein
MRASITFPRLRSPAAWRRFVVAAAVRPSEWIIVAFLVYAMIVGYAIPIAAALRARTLLLNCAVLVGYGLLIRSDSLRPRPCGVGLLGIFRAEVCNKSVAFAGSDARLPTLSVRTSLPMTTNRMPGVLARRRITPPSTLSSCDPPAETPASPRTGTSGAIRVAVPVAAARGRTRANCARTGAGPVAVPRSIPRRAGCAETAVEPAVAARRPRYARSAPAAFPCSATVARRLPMWTSTPTA